MSDLAWTIAELISEDMTVTAYCQADGCRYNQAVDLHGLAVKLGPNARAMAADLAPELRCWMCVARKISLTYSPRTTAPGP